MQHKVHAHHLHKKGWSKKEISHAQSIFDRTKKHPHIQTLDQIVHHALLFVGALGIVIFALYATPLFFFFPTSLLYTTLVLLGFIFGSLFTLALTDFHDLSHHHHLLTFAFFSVVTFASFIAVYVNIQGVQVAGFSASYNVFLSALSFVAGMAAPYTFHLVTDKRWKL